MLDVTFEEQSSGESDLDDEEGCYLC